MRAAQGEEEEEDRRMMKGIVNPAFLSGEEEDEESRGRRRREGGGEIGGDRQDSTLAAHQQQTELEAPANARGNEGARNYFDPSAAVEGDPRRCRMVGVGAGDELELKFMHEDERGLYEKLSQMLNEDDASTIIDLPGSVLEERTVARASKLPLAGWKDQLREQLVERREEVIPHYVEQLRKRVQDDMIPVGRPSLEQKYDSRCIASHFHS
ncbi:orofacial cleft 1 candidate gene 1 protein homolog [Colossoma macropomum]|uniref:orofacial cleft 1 candidate gene 1 protein homolog n=1 Tax=Colossoma macropomum TaxID=42526 RepID=UPI0018651215|nr:orofacial cleft 1 candidate gene 1 protein homolog [Colossoma macropomum]